MVDEYLSEREQAEQLRHWLAANWLWMAAGVLLVVGGWYGYRWWLSEKLEKSLAAEARFTAMLEALGQNNKAEGLKIGGEITTDYRGTPYADQAGLVRTVRAAAWTRHCARGWRCTRGGCWVPRSAA